MKKTNSLVLATLVTSLASGISLAEPFPNPAVNGPVPFVLPAGGEARDYPFYSQAIRSPRGRNVMGGLTVR